MTDEIKVALLNLYTNKILEVVDNRDEFTHGDFIGAIEAIVLGLLNGNHNRALKELLSLT